MPPKVSPRRFPPPWTIDEAKDACFIVRDNAKQALAYVYFEHEPGRRSAAKLLTRDEARRIASNIATLPELRGEIGEAPHPTPAGKYSVLKTERSLKERQCGDQPSREHQGHSPIDKVSGHFSFTPFLFEGFARDILGRSASKSYDDLALGLTPHCALRRSKPAQNDPS